MTDVISQRMSESYSRSVFPQLPRTPISPIMWSDPGSVNNNRILPVMPHSQVSPRRFGEVGMIGGSYGGRVPPPRVLEVVITRTPKKFSQDKEEATEPIGALKKTERKTSIAVLPEDETLTPLHEAIVPPDIERDFTKIISIDLADGKLGFTLSVKQMIVIKASKQLLAQPCCFEKLIGWKLTHINDSPVSELSDVEPLLEDQTRVICRFELCDIQMYEPPSKGSKGCCIIM